LDGLHAQLDLPDQALLSRPVRSVRAGLAASACA